MRKKVLMIMSATLIILSFIGCNSLNSKKNSQEESEQENVLAGKYYMLLIDTSAQVIRFDSDYIIVWVDCGWGREVDDRTKYYGTYEIDGSKLTISLSGEDDKKCVIHDNGEKLTIDGIEATPVEIETFNEKTQKAFD